MKAKAAANPIPVETVGAALQFINVCAEMTEPLEGDDCYFVPRLPDRMDVVRSAALDVLEQHFIDAIRKTPQAAATEADE